LKSCESTPDVHAVLASHGFVCTPKMSLRQGSLETLPGRIHWSRSGAARSEEACRSSWSGSWQVGSGPISSRCSQANTRAESCI